MTARGALALSILAFVFDVAAAQEVDTRPSITALRLGDEERIAVDGRLDEAVWQRAMPATDFAQLDPQNGAPATERTEVRVAFDRDRLYFEQLAGRRRSPSPGRSQHRHQDRVHAAVLISRQNTIPR